jgi:hypothetical protein
MKSSLILASLCFLTANTAPAFASPGKSKEHDHAPPKVSKAFEAMKALVGTWEGTTLMEGKEMQAKITYALTSGGTALVETMGPGSPFEMITVYANNGNNVSAKHYCMIGNQPEMKLKKYGDNQFTFEMDGSKGISSKKEPHMHAVTLTVNGNKLRQDWTNFKEGKKADNAVFEFTKTN